MTDDDGHGGGSLRVIVTVAPQAKELWTVQSTSSVGLKCDELPGTAGAQSHVTSAVVHSGMGASVLVPVQAEQTVVAQFRGALD
jgi:hypothetical protein